MGNQQRKHSENTEKCYNCYKIIINLDGINTKVVQYTRSGLTSPPVTKTVLLLLFYFTTQLSINNNLKVFVKQE